jgi:hypothetical protein
MVRPHQGRPNLGQPGAPLTAVCSAAPLPSRLSSVRYSPCTCSPMEAARHQTREEAPAVQSIRGSIDNPPSFAWCGRRDIRQICRATLYLPACACQASCLRLFLIPVLSLQKHRRQVKHPDEVPSPSGGTGARSSAQTVLPLPSGEGWGEGGRARSGGWASLAPHPSFSRR